MKYKAANDAEAIRLYCGSQRHSATGPVAIVCTDEDVGAYETRALAGPEYDAAETDEEITALAAADLWPSERLVAIR